MYQRFYGLRDLPFELAPNPRFLFLTSGHREALSNLQFGLSTGRGLTVLIGEAGTGKTTLLRAALESEPCRGVRSVSINNPALKRDEFIDCLARGFQLSAEAGRSKTALLSELEPLLLQCRSQGEPVALIIDEAQALSDELLEEIRLLANIETSEERLLMLVLTGQPELAERLNRPELRQLKQRVSLRCEIAPFDLAHAAGYIAARIRLAGGEAVKIFTREAVRLIHERSQGIPRTISVICDNALLSGFALGVQPVTRDIVLDVCRDFDLNDPVRSEFGTEAPKIIATPAVAERAPAKSLPQPSKPKAQPAQSQERLNDVAKKPRSSLVGR